MDSCDLYKLKPGPATDRLIAEKVLGRAYTNSYDEPHWSARMDDAFSLIEKFTSPLSEVITEEGDDVPNKVILQQLSFDRLGYKCCEHDEDGAHGQWRCVMDLSVKEEDQDGNCKVCNHSHDNHSIEVVSDELKPDKCFCGCAGFVSKIPTGIYTHNEPAMAICLAFLDLVNEIGRPLTEVVK